MAGLADVILATNPVSAMQQGLGSGEQLGGSAINALSREAAAKQAQNQLALAQKMAPYQLANLQAQTQLTQEKAKNQPLLDEAALAKASYNPRYAVSVNSVTGEPQMYDKVTGRWVSPGAETTLAQMQGASGPVPLNSAPSTSGQGSPIPSTQPPAPTGAQIPTNGGAQAQTNGLIAQKSPLSTRYVQEETITNPKTGEEKTVITPTSGAATQAETRIMGLGGIEGIRNDIVEAITPYQGGYGRGWRGLQEDILKYNTTVDPIEKNQLAEQLTNYYSIANSKNEIASTLARALNGASPAEGMVIRQAEQALNQTPAIPNNFPKDLFKKADNKMFDLSQKIGTSEVGAFARGTNPNLAAEGMRNKKTSPASSSSSTIAVVSPSGQRGSIPASQLTDALQMGYKRA